MEMKIINSKVLMKSFLIWSFVCSIHASYSFRVALEHRFEPLPMIIGIFIFILFYTLFTSTNWFLDKLKNRNFLAAMISGFLIKIPLIFYMDLFAGLFLVSIVEKGLKGGFSFSKTLLITMVEGVVLNLVIWAMVFAKNLLFWIFTKANVSISRRKECHRFQL